MSSLPAVIKIEEIGDDYYQMEQAGTARSPQLAKYRRRLGADKRPGWVARLTLNGSELQRHYLKGDRDYNQANSVGSRGIYSYYILQPGHVYEIHERIAWKRTRTWWCRVEDGKIIEMNREEALAWLTNGIWG